MIGSVAIAFTLQTICLLISMGAFLLAYAAHRRSVAEQPLNLRVLLVRDLNTLCDHAVRLRRLLDRANHSSRRRPTTINNAVQMWGSEAEADRLAVERLVARLPQADESFFSLSNWELESKLVELHGHSIEVARLFEKYGGSSPQLNQHRERMS